jgi:hypothetical protein
MYNKDTMIIPFLVVIVIGLIICQILIIPKRAYKYLLFLSLFLMSTKNNSTVSGGGFKLEGFILVGPSSGYYWKNLKVPWGNMEIFIIGDIHQYDFWYDKKKTSIKQEDLDRSRTYINSLMDRYVRDFRKFTQKDLIDSHMSYLNSNNLMNASNYFIVDWILKLMVQDKCIDVYMETAPTYSGKVPVEIRESDGFLNAASRTMSMFCPYEPAYLFSDPVKHSLRKACPKNTRYHAVDIRQVLNVNEKISLLFFKYADENAGLNTIDKLKEIDMIILDCVVYGLSEYPTFNNFMKDHFEELRRTNENYGIFEKLFITMFENIHKQFNKSAFYDNVPKFREVYEHFIDSLNRKRLSKWGSCGGMLFIMTTFMDIYTLLRIFVNPTRIETREYHGTEICGTQAPQRVLYYAGAEHIEFIYYFIKEYFGSDPDNKYSPTIDSVYTQQPRSIRLRYEPFVE